MARQIIDYDPIDRPDAELLADDAWWPAEVWQWTHRDDGTWWAHVCWHRSGQSQLDVVPAEQLRGDTVDRSAGRG